MSTDTTSTDTTDAQPRPAQAKHRNCLVRLWLIARGRWWRSLFGAAANRKQKTFEEFCEQAVRTINNPATQCVGAYLPVLCLLGGLGLRTIIGLIPALAVLVALEIYRWTLCWRRWRRRGQSSGDIDWETAPAYEQTLHTRMAPEAAQAVQDTVSRIQQLGHRAHVYIVGCACDKEDPACACVLRWSAGVGPIPGTGRAILFVGDHLLAGSVDVLRFVLVHERTHLVRSKYWAGKLGLFVARDVAAIAGIFAPGMTVFAAAVAVMLAWVLLRWAIEIACDLPAARCHGAAAEEFWAGVTDIRDRARRAVWPWWHRPLRLVAKAVPSHPPVWLRARICRITHAANQ